MTDDFDSLFAKPHGSSWAQRVTQRPLPADEPAVGQVVSGDYQPYGFVAAEREVCDLTYWLKGQIKQGQEIQFRFLIRVAYVGEDHLQLMMSDCVIHIEGRHLRDLRKRLGQGKVTFVQEFNRKIWREPPESEPIISKISVQFPGEPAPLSLNQ